VTAAEVDEDELSRAFTNELTKEMENLMRGMGGEEREEEGELDQDQIKEAERVFKAAWEAMLVEGMNGTATEEEIEGLGNEPGSEPRADAAGSGSAPSTAEPKRNDFQERLKQAMDKMKEAESNLQVNSLVITTNTSNSWIHCKIGGLAF
jgi:peroxin-19